MLDSFPELDDRFFALPRMNSLKTGFLNDDQKMGFQNLGSGSLDWATLAGLNSVPELVPSGQSHSQSQGIPSYGNTNDVYVPTIPTLCQMDTSTNKLGNSVEQEVQSGLRTHQRVGNSGFFQQNSSSLTQNFSNSTDPYGFRYPTQPGGFGFRQWKSLPNKKILRAEVLGIGRERRGISEICVDIWKFFGLTFGINGPKEFKKFGGLLVKLMQKWAKFEILLFIFGHLAIL